MSLRLSLLPLDQPKAGFRQFISCWLLQWEGVSVLVDPGPGRSIPALLEALEAHGVQKLDAVLLTHIHIDHAGGIGDLWQALPIDAIVAHPKAHRHLVDPSKLWEGSRKVLGELAEFYGEIKPVAEEALEFAPAFAWAGRELQVLETPGHAPHHLSFFCEPYAFVGEAVGVRYPMDEGLYLRPATPPRFLPDVFLASIERLAAHPQLPSILCYGHFGQEADAADRIAKALEQTRLWMSIIEQRLEASVEEIYAALQREDPLFALYPHLPEDIQRREDIFVGNSIRGMREYFVRRP